MKFKYKPNEFVIQTITNKLTGHISKHTVCRFDAQGELETFDKKVIFILQNKLIGCTWEHNVFEKDVKAEEVQDILSDDDIRKLAKEKGIKSYWNKKIENIKSELEEMNE